MIDLSGISDRSFIGKLLRAVLRVIPEKTVLPVFQGKLRGKRWIKGSGVNGYWLGSYESEQQSIMGRTLKPGDVVFDIGAHVGFFTLLAAELVGEKRKGNSFSNCLSRKCPLSQWNIKLNKFDNITVMQTAVSDRVWLRQFQGGGKHYAGVQSILIGDLGRHRNHRRALKGKRGA